MFHLRRSIPTSNRRRLARERDAALGRLQQLISRRNLLDVSVDIAASITLADRLSMAHTELLGARAIDLLHVAAALTLEGELFLTTDARQGKLTKAAGLRIVSIG